MNKMLIRLNYRRKFLGLPFMIVSTRHSASFVSYAYARFTTNLELIFCNICFSIKTIDSPLRFFMRFFSNFLHAYILPVARTCVKQMNNIKMYLASKQYLQLLYEYCFSPDMHRPLQNHLYQAHDTFEMFYT